MGFSPECIPKRATFGRGKVCSIGWNHSKRHRFPAAAAFHVACSALICVKAYLGGSKLAAQHEKWAKARLHKSHVLQFCHSKMNSQLQSSLPEVHLIRTRDTRTGLVRVGIALHHSMCALLSGWVRDCVLISMRWFQAAIEVQRVPRAGPLKQDRQRRGVNKSPEKRRRRPRTASGVSPRSRNATPKIANRPTTAGNAKSRSADKKTRVDFFYPGNGANRESDEASDGANELVPPPFPDGLRFEFSSSNPQSYDSDESDGADDQATVNSGRTMDSSAALQSGLQVLVLTRPGFWSLRNVGQLDVLCANRAFASQCNVIFLGCLSNCAISARTLSPGNSRFGSHRRERQGQKRTGTSLESPGICRYSRR